MSRFLQVFLRAILWIFGGLITLLFLLIFLIRLPTIQNFLVERATEYLEGKIGTPVSIGYVSITFPKKIVLERIYFEDQNRDTLIAGDKLLLDIDMFKLLNNTIAIQEIGLSGITSKISRDENGVFNFDYIINSFSTDNKEKETNNDSSPLIFDIGDVSIDNTHFVYKDELIGLSADINLNHFDTKIKEFDLQNNMAFDLPKINIKGLNTSIVQWTVDNTTDSILVSESKNTDPTTSLLPKIATQKINLKNIIISYQDSSSLLETNFDIKSLLVRAELIDLNKEIIKLKEIDLENSISNITFTKPTTIEPSSTTSNSNSETSNTNSNWKVSVDKINVSNTNFFFKDDNQPNMNGFDYYNIGINNLGLDLTSLYYSNDSISGSLTNLAAEDHSGFNLKKLSGNFVYTNKEAVFENLVAETPTSIIRDYIRIAYPSLELATKNLELLTIEANLSKSRIDMHDAAFFSPEIKKIDALRPILNQTIYVDGQVNGKLNNLHIPSLHFRALKDTELLASATIKGLPNVENVIIDLDLKKLSSGKNDLDILLDKSLFPDSMTFNFPNTLLLSGKFMGGLQGFETDLHLNTDRGEINLLGNLNIAHEDTTYVANISIDNFDLGYLLNQDSIIGLVSADAQLNGKGLDINTLHSEVQANLHNASIFGYDYNSIDMNLASDQGSISGAMNSNDPNIKFGLNLDANVRGKYPEVGFKIDVDSVNFQNLKLTDNNLRYHGHIAGDFKTADIDYLNGRIIIDHSFIAFENDRYALDTISLRAHADSTRNTLILNSDFLNAHLVGKYQLSLLSDAINDVIKVYYNPNNSDYTTPNYENQSFEFSATLANSRFIRDLFPGMEKMENISLDGTFNSEQKSIMAKLLAPELIYSGVHLKDIGLDVITVDSTMYYSSLLTNLKYNNIELNNSTFSGQLFKNTLDLGLWIKDKNNVDQYHLGGKVAVSNNNYVFSLFENGLVLNYDKWDIAAENQLKFGDNGLWANDFRLTKNDQEFLIQSTDSTVNSPIKFSFNNFRIETFSKMFESESLQIGGGINGEATLFRLDTKPTLVSNIAIKKIYVGKDTIGDLALKVNNLRENTYSADIKLSGSGNDLQLLGRYYSPITGKSNFDASLTVDALQLKTVEALSFGYLKNNKGSLSGELKINGDLDNPQINGDLAFNKANINIKMLNADLQIDKQKIFFTNQGLNFKQFELSDARGNKAKLNGTILTKTYRDFDFNLNLVTYNFAVVNSSRNDNDLFYGKLYVTSNLRIKGNIDKPIIDGNIKANENTDFVFIVPNENPGLAERDGVVKFVNKGDTIQPNIFAQLDSLTTVSQQLTGFDLALNLSTDREAKFKVVLNEGSQDALNIQGVAELTTAIDASEKITMSGTYTVVGGSYSFSIGPIKREFGFQSGSTITWNGDPLDARLDITALYSRRFSPLELISNQLGPENQNLYRQKIPFDVKLILTGDLFKPDIRFDIDVDNNNAIVSQDVLTKVDNALVALRSDPAEMNKQVFSLIVLGNFMSANPFGGLGGSGGVEGMARNSVSSFLSNQLNNLASDLIKGVDLDFNLQSEQDYLSGAAQTRTDLNVDISKMLFDDRLKITIGSNFEVEGQSRPGENPNNIANDISIEYQLSPDGRYFVRAYRKNQYQATLQGQFIETGIGFIVNINYDKFKEIFMSTKSLESYYNTDNSSFRRRFDVERMESDTAYRDSVRLILRDSLMKHNESFRRRVLEAEQEQDSQPKPSENQINGIRNEEDERSQNEL